MRLKTLLAKWVNEARLRGTRYIETAPALLANAFSDYTGSTDDRTLNADPNLKPNNAEALRLRGRQAAQEGQLDAACELLQQAIELQPDFADALCDLGNVMRLKNDIESSIEYYKTALRYDPAHVLAMFNLAKRYYETDRKNNAYDLLLACLPFENQVPQVRELLARTLLDLRAYQKIVSLYEGYAYAHPDHGASWFALAIAAHELGQLDLAIDAYENATVFFADSAELQAKRGLALFQAGQPVAARQCFNVAISLKPNFPEAYNNLGIALEKCGELIAAEDAYRKALRQRVDFLDAEINLASVLLKQGQHAAANAMYCKAFQLSENDGMPTDKNLVSNYLYSLHNEIQEPEDFVFREHVKRVAEAAKNIQPTTCFPNDHAGLRKLRVGYLSADFKQHSVAYFIEPILRCHNAKHFDVFCYANDPVEDDVSRRIQSLGISWRNSAALSDPLLVAAIKADQIDILIDLSGHTSGNRMLAMAARAAPIQISYLGYPNTTGVPTIDYRFSDVIADPEGAERFYTEKVVRLPGCFLVYQPYQDSPPVERQAGKAAVGIVFGCFNNFAKVSLGTFTTWVKLLNALPTAQLLLKSSSFLDAAVKKSFLDRFAAAGIDVERIVLVGWTASIKEHLAYYQQIDIALDTFPYNGTTTTMESLWMGVPVITLRGHTHSARVGASIMTNVGLREFVAEDADEYVSFATKLAGDRDKLTTLRNSLRSLLIRSPLFDYQTFTQTLERQYQELWIQLCLHWHGSEQTNTSRSDNEKC